MLKKVLYNLAVMGMLLFSTGIVPATFVHSVLAEEQRCKKCGHYPSKPDEECRCSCHKR
ncbi:MAG: hypothetical protein ACUBOA_05730 [Candidatus Loosdrechtia sp.]|uniref:hypothetical protein n=1 Tax=Candidatus Loosdrechtia sp. TaxID=3101272 RepID=UPI003A5E9937|nr:MAG: hypothetical protein QY305_14920 [Candidatus Jettenia sp. AMX2]